MASLASEAEILASQRARDLITEFVYDGPDVDERIELWSRFQQAARRELAGETPRPYLEVLPVVGLLGQHDRSAP